MRDNTPCMIELHKLVTETGSNDGLVPVMLELMQRQSEREADMTNVVAFGREPIAPPQKKLRKNTI